MNPRSPGMVHLFGRAQRVGTVQGKHRSPSPLMCTRTYCRECRRRRRPKWPDFCSDGLQMDYTTTFLGRVAGQQSSQKCLSSRENTRAGARIRTGNLPITNRLRCRVAPHQLFRRGSAAGYSKSNQAAFGGGPSGIKRPGGPCILAR